VDILRLELPKIIVKGLISTRKGNRITFEQIWAEKKVGKETVICPN